MSDEKIVFLADSRGFWRASNAGSAYVEAFRWAMREDGVLRIIGTISYDVERTSNSEWELFAEEPGRLHFDGLRFHIEWEEAPGASPMEVLKLDDGQGRWQMVLRETFGHISSRFRRSRKLAGFKPPGF